MEGFIRNTKSVFKGRWNLGKRFCTSKMQLSHPHPSSIDVSPFKGGGSVFVDLLLLPLFVRVLCLVLVILFNTLCPSSFAIILMWKRELVVLL